MSKIKSIIISNFKFFRSHPAIELNGNHLLLYGENGSGKSSIYYGLYTILQAATKLLPDVQKYFTPGNNEFLLNIYADTQHGPENTGAHICIEDMDNRSYKLSFSDTGCMSDPNLLESNRASDFMNYVSLFRFQLFRNSESADLHDVFRMSILPSISKAKSYVGQKICILHTKADLVQHIIVMVRKFWFTNVVLNIATSRLWRITSMKECRI